MVYGICFCPVSRKEDLKNSKVAGWLQSNSWVMIRWKSAAFSRMLFRLKDADGGREREPVSEAQWGQRFCRLGSSGPVTKHHFHQHAAEVHDFTACMRRLVITVKELFNPLCLYSEQNTIWTRCHMMLRSVWCSTPWTVGCSSKRYNTCMTDRRSGDEAAMTCLFFFFYYWTNLSGVCGYCGSCREVSGEALPAVPGGGGHRPSQSWLAVPHRERCQHLCQGKMKRWMIQGESQQSEEKYLLKGVAHRMRRV